MKAELDRRASAKDRLLARLQQGPATSVELNAICFRYGARLLELKRGGVSWEKEALEAGVYLYRLVRACVRCERCGRCDDTLSPCALCLSTARCVVPACVSWPVYVPVDGRLF